MDYIRHCYQSWMRLFPDRPDILVKGQWHWCLPGAKLIDIPHAFGSAYWESTHPGWSAEDVELGEVIIGDWRRGTPVASLIGDHWCGSDDAWADGSPFSEKGSTAVNADGIPLCCLPSEGEAHGGATFGGLAQKERSKQRDLAFGGEAMGGLASVDASIGMDAASGGATFGGEVIDAATGMDAASGGATFGGEITDAAIAFDQVFGGVTFGGEVCDMCVQEVTVSQQITGGGVSGTVNIGHANSGVTAGTYGTASKSAHVTVDAQGHVTAASEINIAIAAANVSGLATVATSGLATDITGLSALATSTDASLLTGTLALAVIPTTVPRYGTIGQFEQGLKYTLEKSGSNLLVTDPDGTTHTTAFPAAFTMTATLVSLPAGTVLTRSKYNVTTTWTGTGWSACTLSVGYTGGSGGSPTVANRYVNAVDVRTAGTSTPNVSVLNQPECQDELGTWDITATLTSTGGFLSACLTGKLTITLYPVGQ